MSAFQTGMKLIKGCIQLDKQQLDNPGFFERRKLRKAKTHFHNASKLEPANGAPLLFIAKIEDRLGNHESSLEWLKKANQLEPDNLILAIETGAALGRLQMHKEAATALEVAAQHHPHEPRIQSNLGLSYLMAGELENAVDTFKRLNQLEPDFPANQKLLDLATTVLAGNKPIPKTEAEVVRLI